MGLKKLKKHRIFIQLPIYDDMPGRAVAALATLITRCRHILSPGFCFATRIDKARVQLAQMFLNTNCDLMLCIDADSLYRPGLVDKLISHNKDIVSGLYFSRRAPCKPIMYKQKEFNTRFAPITEWEEGKLIEVDGVGMGFCLIKREVVEKIGAKSFNSILLKDLFDEQLLDVEDVSPMGGDLAFCQQARRNGFKVWVDTSVEVGHLGERAYERDDFEMYKLRAALKDVDRDKLSETLQRQKEQLLGLNNKQKIIKPKLIIPGG